jgi:hypothetical protein
LSILSNKERADSGFKRPEVRILSETLITGYVAIPTELSLSVA